MLLLFGTFGWEKVCFLFYLALLMVFPIWEHIIAIHSDPTYTWRETTMNKWKWYGFQKFFFVQNNADNFFCKQFVHFIIETGGVCALISK